MLQKQRMVVGIIIELVEIASNGIKVQLTPTGFKNL